MPHLTPDVWDRLTAAFETLAAVPSSEWRAQAAAAFPDDVALQTELLAMLGADDAAHALAVESRMLGPTTDATPVLPAGAIVGAWRVLDRVGGGGMGEIYRAERTEGAFAQQVAIKVLRGGFVADELRRRFDRERRILARLQHPHIVRILDGGTLADGRPWLAMPWVDGDDILTYCRTRALGLTERLRLFRVVCTAVAYANAQLVVHRDLKPSNILVTTDGVVQLLDFGIAKLLQPEHTGEPGADESRVRLLTPEHAAPEQLLGDAVSTATDVYGLGVLLFELLADDRPFRSAGRPVGVLEQEILTREPPLPSEVSTAPWRRLVRGDLDRIVLMALRKEPARRYASAAALGDDIARYLGQRPVHAEADRLGYRAGKFVRRNAVAVALTSLLLTVLLAFTGTTWRQSRLLSRERDVARREKGSADQALALLSGFFAQANPRLNPGGDTLRVGQLLEFAAQQVDSLRGDPELQARLLRVLGNMYMARGEAARAERLLQRAHEQLTQAPMSAAIDRAMTYHELARAVEAYRGRAAAAPMFKRSVEELSKLLPDTARDRELALLDLAAYTDDVLTQQALSEALASDSGLAHVSSPIDRAERIHGLAQQRLSSGRLREAIALFEESLRLVDSVLPLTHPDRILVYGNVAAARRAGGDIAQALAPTRERIAALERQQPRAPLALAAAREIEAVILAELGQFGEAERLERDVLATWRAYMAPTQPSHALTLHNLAFIAAAQGRRTEALGLIDSALTLQRAAGAAPADWLGYRDVRAELLMWDGQWAASAAELARITAGIDSTFPVGHAVRNAHELRRAVQELHDGASSAALARATRVLAVMRPLVPTSYPPLLQAECILQVAGSLAVRGGDDDRRARACERYRRYGVHSRALLSLADQLPAARE